jgi:beta-lysine 5,6-aminomutase beta subunit
VNLGAQVEVPDLVARSRVEAADAVLVSQVVTQRDAHLKNAREVAAAFAAAAGRFPGGRRPLLVMGGPRYAPESAADLGVDKVFGKSTTPGEVASYLAHALAPVAPEAISEPTASAGGTA